MNIFRVSMQQITVCNRYR